MIDLTGIGGGGEIVPTYLSKKEIVAECVEIGLIQDVTESGQDLLPVAIFNQMEKLVWLSRCLFQDYFQQQNNIENNIENSYSTIPTFDVETKELASIRSLYPKSTGEEDVRPDYQNMNEMMNDCKLGIEEDTTKLKHVKTEEMSKETTAKPNNSDVFEDTGDVCKERIINKTMDMKSKVLDIHGSNDPNVSYTSGELFCHKCNKSFQTKKQFRSHVRVVHERKGNKMSAQQIYVTV